MSPTSSRPMIRSVSWQSWCSGISDFQETPSAGDRRRPAGAVADASGALPLPCRRLQPRHGL
ncbi:hypothetical protein, partial [Xanthomonas translucens]|uniref:hypothetical protein n=1 Tax=Xanthomonas campestris pv. translucens TaxID=343 RepID=UPI001E374027